MKKKLLYILSVALCLTISSNVYAGTYKYYKVQENDSLYKLSKQFGVTIDYLTHVNKLTSTLIFKGSSLIVGENDSVQISIDDTHVTSASASFIQDGRTMVPIRFISEHLGAQVAWISSERCAVVIFNQNVYLIKENSKNAYVNNILHTLDVSAQNINGRIFVPLRFIAENHNFDVEWNHDNKAVNLISPENAVLSAQNYSDEDLFWLSRIIHAESQGQPFQGKLAVGAVILNRISSNLFPNTIKDVIFQFDRSWQFSPVRDGSINNTPSQDSIIAAKMVLNGYNIEEKALFFLNPDRSTNFWITRNKKFIVSIGDHDFYQ